MKLPGFAKPNSFLCAVSRGLPGAWIAILIVLAGTSRAHAQSQITLSLAVTDINGNPATTIATGSAVRLAATARPTAGGTVSVGQIVFCNTDGGAACRSLGETTVNSSGIAQILFHATPGTHTYQAYYPTNSSYGYATSATASVTVVVGVHGTTATSVTQTGTAGNLTFNATVTNPAGNASFGALTGSVAFTDTNNSNFLLATSPVTTGYATYGFGTAVTYPVSGGIHSLVVGDLNADGYPDILIGANANRLQILSGGAGGALTTGPSFSLPATPAAATIADINNDGIPDIVVVMNGYIYWFTGNGDGTFSGANVLRNLNGVTPSAVVTGDFDGDGRQDVAVAYGTQIYIYTTLNGQLRLWRTFAAGGVISGMVSADFNGDGFTDLAVTIPSQQAALVFTNNGDGTFTNSASLSVGNDPESIIAYDFNNDGRPDLAVGDDSAKQVHVFLLQNDSVTWLQRSNISPGITPSFLAAGDINNDGNPDLIIGSNADTSLVVYFNYGNGVFTGPISVATGVTSSAVVAGDWDGDGVPDIAYTDTFGNTVITAQTQAQMVSTASASPTVVGTGNHTIMATYLGTTAWASSSATVSAPASPVPVTLALTSNSTSAFLGQAITFTVAASPVNVTGDSLQAQTVTLYSDSSKVLAAALFNSSGVATMSATDIPFGTHSITAKYSSDSSFETATSNPISVTITSYTTTLAILSAGTPVSTVTSGSTITLKASAVNGTTPLTAGLVLFCDAAYPTCSDIAVLGTAALRSDGTASLSLRPAAGTHGYRALLQVEDEMLATASTTQSLTVSGTMPTTTTATASATTPAGTYIFTTTATAAYSASQSALPSGTFSILDPSIAANGGVIGTTPATGSSASLGFNAPIPYTRGTIGSIAIGDLNGDGFPDILTAENGTCTAYLNDGTGKFTSVTNSCISGDFPGALDGVALGDFNGDGKLDAVFVSSTGPAAAIYVAMGNGDGTFGTPTVFKPYTSSSFTAVAVADFNGDGNLDIAAADSVNGYIYVMLGNGNGQFTAAPGYVFGYNNRSLAVGDIFGEGRQSMATVDYGNRLVYVLRGLGDGTFNSATQYYIGNSPTQVILADLNQDGFPDMITADSADNTLSVLLNNGDGTFQQRTTYPCTNPTSIAVLDFNHDGKPDIACAESGNADIRILQGDGTGRLTSIGTFANGLTPSVSRIVAADLNMDGATDIVTAAGNFTTMTGYARVASATSGAIAVYGSGTRTVQAVYSGDANYATSSQSLSVTGALASSSLNLGSSLSSFVYLSPTTLTATVATNTAIVPTGTVQFYDNGVALGTPQTLNSSGVATLVTSTNGAGSRAISASYSGDTHYTSETSSSSLALNVAKATVPILQSWQSLEYMYGFNGPGLYTTPYLTISIVYTGTQPTGPPYNQSFAVGPYPFIATIVDDNYQGVLNGTYTVTKNNITVSVGTQYAAYDGTPKSVTYSDSHNGTPVAQSPATITYNGSPTAILPGTYTAVVTLADPNNAGVGTGTLIISQGTAGVSIGSTSQTYDGNPHPVTVATTPANLTTVVTYNGSSTVPTAAGTYTVVATINDSRWVGTSTATLTIGKAAAVVTVSSQQVVFDGSPHTVSVTTVPANLAFATTYNGSLTPPSADGNYTVVATINDSNYAGSGSGLLQISTQQAVGTVGPTQFITVSLPAGGTLASNLATAIHVLTQGAPSVDYQYKPGGTCAPGATFPAQSSCTVGVAFAPMSPGFHAGRVQVFSQPGQSGMLGSANLAATGTAAMLTFPQASQVAITPAADPNSYKSLVVDGAGNVFYIWGSQLNEYVAATQTIKTIAPLGLGFAMVMDPAGNLIVADGGVTMYMAADNYQTSQPIGTHSFAVLSVGVDKDSNIYSHEFIYDQTSGQYYADLLKWSPSDGYTNAQTVEHIPTSNIPLGSMATDKDGSVYFYDPDDGNVYRYSALNGTTQLITATDGVSSIAIDTMQNLYLAETSSITKVNIATGQTSSIGSFNDLQSIGVDSFNRIYAYDTSVEVIDGTLPPSISFDSAHATIPSDSFPTVIVGNWGNQPLNLSSLPITPSDFSIFAAGTNCSLTSPVPSSSTCNIQITATPQAAGTRTGTLTIASNSLVATGTNSQTIPLTIVGLSPPASITLGALNAIYDGTSHAVTVTTSPVTFSVTVTYNSSAMPPTEAGSYSVVATSTDPNNPATATGTLVIAPAALTITANPAVFIADGQPHPATFTTIPANIAISVLYNGSTTIPTASGTYAVTASSANPDYAGATASSLVLLGGVAAFTAPQTPVGITSAPVSVSVLLNGNGTLNASPFQAFTQGATGKDFSITAGGTCVSGMSYTANQVCVINVLFKPSTPGLRTGAIAVFDNTGQQIGTSYISGVGTGPLGTFISPAARASLSTAFTADSPCGMAIDGNGNIFITNYFSGKLQEYIAATGQTVQIGASHTYTTPTSAVVDGRGNVFIADVAAYNITRLSPSDNYATASVVASLSNAPWGLAIDPDGNIFYTTADNSSVYELLASEGYGTSHFLANGFYHPQGINMDAQGNLYIADATNGHVWKMTKSGNSYTQARIGPNFSAPSGVALDAAENVYVTDQGAGTVTKFYESTSYTTSVVLATGLNNQVTTALDGQGNLYISDLSNSRVARLDLSDAPTITFAETNIGITSADSPVTISVSNIGNTSLTLATLSDTDSANFPLTSATTCAAATQLAAGQDCSVTSSFIPQTLGIHTASLTFVDNSFNLSALSRVATLTGRTPSTPATVALTNLTATYDGTPHAATATTTPAGLTTVTTYNGSPIVPTSAGSYTVISTIVDNVYSGSATGTLIIAQATSSLQWFPAINSTYAGASLTGIFTAVGSVPGVVSYQAVQLPSAAPVSAFTITTLLSAGTYTVTATFAPTDSINYSGATATFTFTLHSMNIFVTGASGTVSSFFDSGAQQSSPSAGGGIGAAVDASGNVWSIDSTGASLSIFSDTGVRSSTATGGGINAATAIAIDGSGTAWVANGDGSVSSFTSNGTPASSTTMVRTAGINAPASISVDSAGSLWIANSGNDSITEVIGAAAPVAAPTVTQVINSNPGVRP